MNQYPARYRMLDKNTILTEERRKSADPAHFPNRDDITRILIVDDHELLREGLTGLLQTEPDFRVAGEAADGEKALQLSRKLKPDVIIMDINLGDMNGIDVTRKILSVQPDIRVIGLSMRNDPGTIKAMYEAGAAGYLDKSLPTQELINTIRNCMKSK